MEKLVVLDEKNRLLSGGVVRTVFALAAPTLISSLLQNMQTIIDLYWVGFLGPDALAAVAISGTLFMTVFPVILGTCAGAVALVSRSIGAGDMGDAERVAGEAWRAALLLGLVMGIAGTLSASWLAKAVGAEGAVLQMCNEYLVVLFAGTFTAFLLFVGNSILHSAGNTVVPMIVMILANVINMFLDPVLIFGNYGIPAMGIRGAAVATVTSQFISAGIVFYLLKRGREGIRMRIGKPHRGLMLRLLKVGLPGTGQMLSRSLMAIALMSIVAGLGMTATAAYGIGLRVLMVLLMPCFAVGNAVATVVGQNLGANQPDRAARAAWSSAFITALIILGAAVALWFGGGWVASQFTDVEEIRDLCVQFLRITAPFYVFVAFAIVLGRGFMGAGDTVPPFICTVISLWGLQVPLALVLPRYFAVPVHGVWWAMSAAITVHGIMVASLFLLGRWKLKKV